MTSSGGRHTCRRQSPLPGAPRRKPSTICVTASTIYTQEEEALCLGFGFFLYLFPFWAILDGRWTCSLKMDRERTENERRLREGRPRIDRPPWAARVCSNSSAPSPLRTAGATCFPECLKYSGKSQKHSATLGEELPGMLLTGKSSSPSAKNRTLGEDFPECHGSTRGRFNAVDGFFTLPRVQHSGKKFVFFEISSPSDSCQGTRGRLWVFFLIFVFPECQVPGHSGKARGHFF
jgi:hypothetical protein